MTRTARYLCTCAHATVETPIDTFQVIIKRFQKLIGSIEACLINIKDRIMSFTSDSDTHNSDFSKTTFMWRYLYGDNLLNRISELEKQRQLLFDRNSL